jgi:RNA polymerase sigma factor (sigma-70 family)
MRAVASRYVHTQDVEDAVQETMALALKNIDKFQPPGNFYAWLGKITHNHICSTRRRPVKIEYRELFDEEHPTVAPLDDGLSQELQAAMDAISEDDRRLLMDLMCGYTPSECAQTRGMRPAAVWKWLFNLRNRLKYRLENSRS